MTRKPLVVVVALTTLFGVAPAANAAAQLTATFIQASVWDSGYGGRYNIRNTGDTASTSWTIEFDLPSGTTISSSWSSNQTRMGQHYRFTNTATNGTIAPGDSKGWGFNADGLGTPLNCTVNGAACGTPPPADTQVPTAPTGLRLTGATSSSVSLAWTASTDDVGVTDYQVFQGTSVVDTVSTTSSTVTGLAANTSYTFTVKARDAAGNVSTASSAITATTTSGGGGGTTVDVSTTAQLQTALANAAPGQTIKLAAGTYHGSFVAQKAGTAAKPITLTGPRTAVLVNDGPAGDPPDCPAPASGYDSGYGLWLYNAPYWNLTGFTVTESKKGVVVDNSNHTTIDGVYVHHVDEEAVHFRKSSADSVLRDSKITDTGLVQKGYGEGVYIGSANSNWGCHGNSGGVDRGDRVQVIGNRIGPNIAAEPIDVKEGTFNGVIRGNTFDGQGISGENSADSWIDVKGIGYTIEDNTASFTKPGTFANGYETHNPGTSPSFPNGCGNVWRNNRSDLGGVGEYAIKITSVSSCEDLPNVVYASNTVTGATKGLTNVPVTP
jgi:hypothetical protein